MYSVCLCLTAIMSTTSVAANHTMDDAMSSNQHPDIFSSSQYSAGQWNFLEQDRPAAQRVIGDFSDVKSKKNQYIDVPELGGQVGLISQLQEKRIGEKVLRQVRHSLPVLQDAWLEDQLSEIFASIYAQTGLGQPIALVIVGDPQINAFAVPGGLFAINSGLLTTANHLDEVAGVMAHEIAHVTQRHYSRSKEAFKGQGLLSLAGLLAGIAVASQSPDAGAAVMLGSQAALMDQQLSYSRNQEREADRVGMQYMNIAGYNPESMADFFELMQRSSIRLSYMPDFWLTHPLTTERMSEARIRARQYAKPKNYDASQNNMRAERQQRFDMIRWRVSVLSGYANIQQLKVVAAQDTGAALALATHYIRQSEFKDAKKILDQIQANATQKNLYFLTLSDWYKAQGQYTQALATILPYYQIAPENRALALQVAEIYILNQQPDQAIHILQPLSQQAPQNVTIWQLLQRAASLQTNSPVQAVNVLRYRAEAQFWSGQEEEGIKSLIHAQRLLKDTSSLKVRVESRLEEMQNTRQLKL